MKMGKIEPIISEAAKTVKSRPVGKTVPKELQYIDHFGIEDKTNIQMHIAKLEKYLETNPNGIDVRTQLAKLKQIV